ncbi:hypothetical protein [Bartonella rattaustraliani]|uniref:hypothetical protein n=1 Tax=Bartonella rattaustraliani TaxID=481139 RepID=UPI000311595E|nr:hypothetical protein [Bartonella rattaustraliani]
MKILLIIFCILLVLTFIEPIIELLSALTGIGVIALGLYYLGFVYSVSLIIALMITFTILMTIRELSSQGKTWKEIVLYYSAVFLPVIISWRITCNFIGTDIGLISCAITFSYSIFSFYFVFYDLQKDIENITDSVKAVAKFYCAALILWAIFYWNELIGIISVIIFIIGYFIVRAYSNFNEDESSNENASEEH